MKRFSNSTRNRCGGRSSPEQPLPILKPWKWPQKCAKVAKIKLNYPLRGRSRRSGSSAKNVLAEDGQRSCRLRRVVARLIEPLMKEHVPAGADQASLPPRQSEGQDSRERARQMFPPPTRRRGSRSVEQPKADPKGVTPGDRRTSIDTGGSGGRRGRTGNPVRWSAGINNLASGLAELLPPAGPRSPRDLCLLSPSGKNLEAGAVGPAR